MNLPNKLTILRIILIPVFILFCYLTIENNYIYACAAFLLASITDILDGEIARRKNLVTTMGKLMDPIADKLLVGSAIIILTVQGSINPVLAIILIGREFVISGFRAIAAADGKIMAADIYGKIKTIVQSIAIIALFIAIDQAGIFFEILFYLGTVLIWISGVLSIGSCINYIMKNKEILLDKSKQEG